MVSSVLMLKHLFFMFGLAILTTAGQQSIIKSAVEAVVEFL